MKKAVFAVLLIISIFFMVGCKSATSPDQPEQKYKTYNLKITYQRVEVQGEYSDLVTVGLHFAMPYGDGTFLYFQVSKGTLIQIDKLTFEAIAEAIPSNDYPGAKKHYIWAVDPNRYDGNQSSRVVGTDFYIEGPKNKIKLTHIIPNTFDDGKMAEFILKKDGTLVDE